MVTMSEQDSQVVDAFIDLRSPYSYLALKPARMLAERSGFRFDWWPFITDFRSAYGGEVEERTGRDIAKDQGELFWGSDRVDLLAATLAPSRSWSF